MKKIKINNFNIEYETFKKDVLSPSDDATSIGVLDFYPNFASALQFNTNLLNIVKDYFGDNSSVVLYIPSGCVSNLFLGADYVSVNDDAFDPFDEAKVVVDLGTLGGYQVKTSPFLDSNCVLIQDSDKFFIVDFPNTTKEVEN